MKTYLLWDLFWIGLSAFLTLETHNEILRAIGVIGLVFWGMNLGEEFSKNE